MTHEDGHDKITAALMCLTAAILVLAILALPKLVWLSQDLRAHDVRLGRIANQVYEIVEKDPDLSWGLKEEKP